MNIWWKQIIRRPLWSVLFALLLVAAFSIVFLSSMMYDAARDSVDELDKTYTSVAIMNDHNYRTMKSELAPPPMYDEELKEEVITAASASEHLLMKDERTSLMGYSPSFSAYLMQGKDVFGSFYLKSANEAMASFEYPYAASVLLVECTGTEDEGFTYTASFDIDHEKSPALLSGYSDINGLQYEGLVRIEGEIPFEVGKRYLLYITGMSVGGIVPDDWGTAYELSPFSFTNDFCLAELYGTDAGTLLQAAFIDGDANNIHRASSYLLPFIEVENSASDALNSEHGQLWQRVIETCKISHGSMRIVKTSALFSIYGFNSGQMNVVEGRAFTEDEYAQGERVCIVSMEVASQNSLNVGDRIELSFYNNGYVVTNEANGDRFYPRGYDFSTALGEPVEFEIVGLFSGGVWEHNYYFNFDMNTVFVPAASITEPYEFESVYRTGILSFPVYNPEYPDAEKVVNADGTISYEYELSELRYAGERPGMLSFVIKNGELNEFMTEMEQLGYGEHFYYSDMGYEQALAAVLSLSNGARTFLFISLAVGLLCLGLFFTMAVIQQKKQNLTLYSIGATRRTVFANIYKYLLFFIAAGCIMGAVISLTLFDRSIAGLLLAMEIELAAVSADSTFLLWTAILALLGLNAAALLSAFAVARRVGR
ncbi:MAG: ABC transporter permease [Clostridia bacterium]|nr:ABC transporter permease [Clostridia bacterium]